MILSDSCLVWPSWISFQFYGPFRFGPSALYRFGSVRFGSVRFGSIPFGSVRFDPVRSGSVRFGSGDLVQLERYYLFKEVRKIGTCCRFEPNLRTSATGSVQRAALKLQNWHQAVQEDCLISDLRACQQLGQNVIFP